MRECQRCSYKWKSKEFPVSCPKCNRMFWFKKQGSLSYEELEASL